MIEETFNDEKRNEYFAIRYVNEDVYNRKGEYVCSKMLEENGINFIRLAGANDDNVYDELLTHEDDGNISEKFMVLPTLNKRLNNKILIVGSSGGRKTSLIMQYAKLYRMINKECQHYLYFTMNDVSGDHVFDSKIFSDVDLHLFIEKLVMNKSDVNFQRSLSKTFKNSLIVFDDIGGLDGVNKKAFFTFIDLSLENFRKYNVSIIIVLHNSRLRSFGDTIKSEMNNYILCTGEHADMQIVNDRILQDTFKLPPKIIRKILSAKGSWKCVDTKRHVAISPNKIFMIRQDK